jgi:hypothetical protein
MSTAEVTGLVELAMVAEINIKGLVIRLNIGQNLRQVIIRHGAGRFVQAWRLTGVVFIWWVGQVGHAHHLPCTATYGYNCSLLSCCHCPVGSC